MTSDPIVCSAQLLDGSSVAGFHGQLSLTSQGLCFSDEQGRQRRYSLDAIRDIARLAGKESLLELHDPEHPPPTSCLRFKDATMHQAIEQAMQDTGGLLTTLRVGARRLSLIALLIALLIIAPLGFLAYTHGASALHRLVSIDKEVALGEFVYNAYIADAQVCDDPQLLAACQTLVDDLVHPDSPYTCRVTVLQEEDPNAFALPGGRMLIHHSLLSYTDDPDALAGVLAHEIAHVEQRHGLKQLFRSFGTILFMQFAVGGGLEELETLEAAVEFSSFFVLMKYSRDQEREADRFAVSKLKRNEISADGMLKFFSKLHQQNRWMDKLGWVSTHPVNNERVDFFQAALDTQSEALPPCIQEHTYQVMQQACSIDAKGE